MAASRTELARKKNPNEINDHKSRGKKKTEQKNNMLKKDCGINALALRIRLAQQQLKDLGSKQSNYSMF